VNLKHLCILTEQLNYRYIQSKPKVWHL